MKKNLTKYSIATTVGLLLAIYILWQQDITSAANNVDIFRILTDAFSIPGILLIMVSALVWISSEGFFDGIGYAFGRAAQMLIPFINKNNERYYDYKLRKAEKRSKSGFAFLFFTGLGFLAVSVVFLILFYINY